MTEDLDRVKQSSYFKQKLAELKNNQKVTFSGLTGSAKAAVLAALAEQTKGLLVVTASTSEAENVRNEIEVFSGRRFAILPASDTDVLPGKDLVGERLAVLNGRQNKQIIAPVAAVLQKTSRRLEKIGLSEDQEIRIDTVIGKLIDFGYRRFDIVGEKGEFSVRGGILDIYPVSSAYPVRLEFLEDRVESLRTFDPYSQRSLEKTAEIMVLPAFEKAEVTVIDVLPEDITVALDEPLELERAAGQSLKEIIKRAKIELSSFLKEGDEPLHIDKLEIVPRKLAAAPPEGVAEELLADLKVGDYVVHENYGIGIYQGMKQLEIEGVKQEYLLIEYAENDKLYVPPHMIGLVERYVGGRESRPRLSHLGTREWLRTRNRIKQSVRDMTRELLAVYAVREKLEGHAFPADDAWQKELEATFPYEETPDQLKAIVQVKKDMESPCPMDRLVCGDVGYGKTEVAIRAAVKAVSAGKQVALLAPTTILVEQHYNNFKQRFHNLPFVVEMLSRFKSAKEQKAAVKALGEGGADIVIGTHRLLSKDVKFKDLGLLIIDEEQKFGVAHKEKLKQLRKTVDVLTLTATPIPRTLYFSLSGIREMSRIATPPVDRSPIRTYILPFSDQVIRAAVLRELDRGGQIYFVHNYVETIRGVASKLQKLIPEARFIVGHGRMEEKELERTMTDFLERKADVLICTSIIESGLDIPNVNTILIDRADRFGLSQLYQIRGRVGRSAVRAYAYLFYHPARSMTDQAVERLKAIQEFTALGSGYKLAMRDLEIRGAGNLLGAEQSGHIYAVGFDLYCELLEEAVKEIKGEKVTPVRDVEIDLKVEASIPSDYVTDDRQRIALYRRMNLIADTAGIEELKKELEDRFGKVPPQIETLFRILELKIEALKSGVKNVKEEKNKLSPRGKVLLNQLLIAHHH